MREQRQQEIARDLRHRRPSVGFRRRLAELLPDGQIVASADYAGGAPRKHREERLFPAVDVLFLKQQDSGDRQGGRHHEVGWNDEWQKEPAGAEERLADGRAVVEQLQQA